MKTVLIARLLTFFAALLSVVSLAEARSEYVSVVNTQLGSSVSCSACHSGSASEGNAVLPLALTYRTGAELGGSDSDGDGFTNKQEAAGALLDFNDANISPFTRARDAEGSSSQNVAVFNGGIVTETAITDVYAQAGITIAAGYQLVSNGSPLVTAFPATVTFSEPLVSTSKVYIADFNTNTSTLITSGLTYNRNGSVTITGTGIIPPVNIVAVRANPTYPAAGSGGYSVGEDDECMTAHMPTTMLMAFMMLTLALFINRK